MLLVRIKIESIGDVISTQSPVFKLPNSKLIHTSFSSFHKQFCAFYLSVSNHSSIQFKFVFFSTCLLFILNSIIPFEISFKNLNMWNRNGSGRMSSDTIQKVFQKFYKYINVVNSSHKAVKFKTK